ncbi:hypothetical protein ANANG_G00293720 [Anguilla anguilla]|uniref:Tripartite motif-containing protein 16 n=1 Tax=Anguilla anguilla TaxID=7936 RepID=A0A9D3LLJ5_ANGAN|nr:hypothetical protein ANANG_G00293720 [Anguilla anguilla]
MAGLDTDASPAQSEASLASSGSIPVPFSLPCGHALAMSHPEGALVDVEIREGGARCQHCRRDDPGPKSEQGGRACPHSTAERDRNQGPPGIRGPEEEQKTPDQQEKPGQPEEERPQESGPLGPEELKEEAPGPEDVACDACLESTPHKAVKSCLTCLVSYCQTHLRPHLENRKFQNHRLVEPVRDIECRTCEGHSRPLELYCPADACCVCQGCVEEGHRGHSLIPLTEARREIEKELQQKEEEMMKMVTAAEKAISKLQTNTISIKGAVLEARAVTEQQFAVLRAAVEGAQREVTEALEAEEKRAVQRADGVRAHLEQKLAEVRRAQTRAEKLFRNKNDVDFLQVYSQWRKEAVDVSLPGVYIGLIDRLTVFSHMVTESTQELCGQLLPAYRDKLKDAFKGEKLGVKNRVGVVSPGPNEEPEPQTREDFLKYAALLSFDPDTAHSFLRLTEGNRKAANTAPWQHDYPDGPGRFAHWRQVMAAESFCLGRHYFEVEAGGDGLHVGVTYKSIDRKSGESNGCIAGNDFSWCLQWNGRGFSAWHSDSETPLKGAGGHARIGVYVDYDRGLLAFYGVGASMTLMHKYQAEFLEPLYPAFWLSKKENWVQLVSPWDDPSTPCMSPPQPLKP